MIDSDKNSLKKSSYVEVVFWKFNEDVCYKTFMIKYWHYAQTILCLELLCKHFVMDVNV